MPYNPEVGLYNPDGSTVGGEYTRQNVTDEQKREWRRQELIKKALKERAAKAAGTFVDTNPPTPEMESRNEDQIRKLLATTNPTDRRRQYARNNFGESVFDGVEEKFDADVLAAKRRRQVAQDRYEKEMKRREEQHFFDNEFARQMRQRYGR